MEFDGKLISELGAKSYLRGVKATPFASLNPLQTQAAIESNWDKCNLGCHTPSYRVLRRGSTYKDALSAISKASPLAAGVVDGVHTQTVRQVDLLASGSARTAEGLGLVGKERFSQVGAENTAALSLVKVGVPQLLDTSLTVIDNPLAQLVFTVVLEYMKLIPEWAVAKAFESRALILPEESDKQFIISAASRGLVEAEMLEHLDTAASIAKNPALKFAGGMVGRKIAASMACIVAAKVSRKILMCPGITWTTKKRLATMRSTAKSVGGAAGTVLVALLKANGWLAIAAESSRGLEADCPKLWRFLRYRCGGIDMLLFLVEGSIREYLDRIAILEKSPDAFMKMMAALVKAGKTSEIFLPQ